MTVNLHEGLSEVNSSERKNPVLTYKTHLYSDKAPVGSNVEITYVPISASLKLDELRSPIGMGVYASGNENFAAAHFVRDGVRVAEDLLDLRPEIAEETILTAVKFQALSDDPRKDALSGLYHHEYRSRKLIDNQAHLSQETKEKAVNILQKLGSKWGGTAN